MKGTFGFTMVELLMVIVTLGIIAVIALPKFLDFRREARVAVAQQYVNTIRGAIPIQARNIAVNCNVPNNTPIRTEAIQLNDLTEDGNPEAHCSLDDFRGDLEKTKLVTGGSAEPPPNPMAGNSKKIVQTNASNICEIEYEPDAGYFHNPGVFFGHPNIDPSCPGRYLAEFGSEEDVLVDGSGSGGGDGDDAGDGGDGGDSGDGGDDGGACVPDGNYTYDGSDCRDSCGQLAEMELCDVGGECTPDCYEGGPLEDCPTLPACACGGGDVGGCNDLCEDSGSAYSADNYENSNCGGDSGDGGGGCPVYTGGIDEFVYLNGQCFSAANDGLLAPGYDISPNCDGVSEQSCSDLVDCGNGFYKCND